MEALMKGHPDALTRIGRWALLLLNQGGHKEAEDMDRGAL
jgi:hypothetical protein